MILQWLQKHVAVMCIAVGAVMTVFVFISWAVGYYCNALYGMKFQLDSCWAGLSAIAISGVGIAKWIIDSVSNSAKYGLPAGYSSTQTLTSNLSQVFKSTNSARPDLSTRSDLSSKARSSVYTGSQVPRESAVPPNIDQQLQKASHMDDQN